MNRILEFDRMVRGVFSVFYRIILLLYGFVVLLRFQNYFQWYVYLVAMLMYSILVWLLISKKPGLHKIRLLTDYALITLILFDKQVDTLYCLIFLLLPVFNAPNFSGRRRSYWLLYGVPVTIFFVLTHRHFDFWILVPFIGLFWLSYFEYIRSRAFNFYYGLTNSISEFYDARTKPGNEYKIYEEIIKKFNGTKFSTICSIDNIFCLLVRGDKYFVQNGSALLFDIEIVNLREFLNKMKQGDVFSNVTYKISGNPGPVFNIVVPIKRDDTYTVFFMSGKQKTHIINSTPYLRDKFFLTSFLKPFYKQLSELFASEYYFRRARIRKFEDISRYYEEADHGISWQTDQVRNWRRSATNAVEALLQS